MILDALAPAANTKAEKMVTPEQHDAYVQEFQQDPERGPVVDGVGGYTDEEVAEIQEAIRKAEGTVPPKDQLTPGEMWSDKVNLPQCIDKKTADESKIKVAQEQLSPEHCQRFWPSPHQVCGAILDRYRQLGGATSWLLTPIENESVNPDGQGYRQRFMNGFISWHPDTGAHTVTNRNALVWERNGWESGWLGYPTGEEVPVKAKIPVEGTIIGWVQPFQGGRIYRTLIQQVASISRLILEKWLELGGPTSELGFPIADEAETGDGAGRFSLFQRGAIYCHPTTGTHAVSGLFYEVWAREGLEAGKYGYPLGDAYVDFQDNSYRQIQDFQGESINLNTALENDRTISVDGNQVGEYVATMLVRSGVPMSSFADLRWSSTPEYKDENDGDGDS